VCVCALTWITSNINDNYGHATRRFRAETGGRGVCCSLTETDIFARFGERKFAILLPGACRPARPTRGAIARHDHGGHLYPDLAPSTVFREFEVASSTRSGYELRQLIPTRMRLLSGKHAGSIAVVASTMPLH